MEGLQLVWKTWKRVRLEGEETRVSFKVCPSYWEFLFWLNNSLMLTFCLAPERLIFREDENKKSKQTTRLWQTKKLNNGGQGVKSFKLA